MWNLGGYRRVVKRSTKTFTSGIVKVKEKFFIITLV